MTDQDGSLIAIVGASGRFPGAPSLRDFWQNLSRGIESVRPFTDEELLAAGESPEALTDPAYVKAWPVLDGIELFDAGFFGMSPRDAAVMDPQHRLFLEVTWEAMEDAGYDPESAGGPVGVFASCGMNTYMMHHLVTNREVMETVGEWLVRHTGNDMNFLATRVSYQMNLKGPALNVQTACSSSLVAVHLACQSLLSGECDMALAGASALSLPQDRGYFFREGEILSPDGHCRPFDAGSSGTLFGSGAGAVVLKRLADARRDGDRVLAVIRGSAINNDGSVKIGYLAPSVDGQARAISEAIAISGLDAESISYIEAHGTGTALGDPIEIAALSQAFAAYTEKKQFAGIGSVKANIGHLGEAAGMASLLKMVLAFTHRALPPSINYERPNPEIDFASSPVYVHDRLTEWKTAGTPRRAGITSLGAGGTNAHLIVEEPPPPPESGPARSHQVLVLSAKTATALDTMTGRLLQSLREPDAPPLADAAFTLQVGRKAFAHRRAFVASSVGEAVSVLEARDPKRIASGAASGRAPALVFLFPGGAAQYPGMGAELYRSEPPYREAIDECLRALEPDLGQTARRLLLEPAGDPEAASTEFERTPIALPATFATSYATSRLLASWGLEPALMIGHSMGEYVAACLAGVMSLPDALRLLSLRGRLIESLPKGAMLGVPLPEEEVRALLGAHLSLAAVNGPALCVVSGPEAAVTALERTLAGRDVESARLRITAPGHSALLDPVLPEFERFVRSIRLAPPEKPFVSNLTGGLILAEEATDPRYWVRHFRETVRFGDGLREAMGAGDRVLVEIGPGRALTSVARQQYPGARSVCTLHHPREPANDVEFLLGAVGRLFTFGVEVDWGKLRGDERRRRVQLPTYPFERNRYWVERGNALSKDDAPKDRGPLRKKPDVADWFYLPSWKRSVAPKAEQSRGTYLIFMDDVGLGEALALELPREDVIQVEAGWTFTKFDDRRFAVRPGRRADYEALLESLASAGRFPSQIVHLWAVTRPKRFTFRESSGWGELSHFDEMQEKCFDSLLMLAQVLGERDEPVTLSVVSNDVYAVADEPVRQPVKALVVGPVRVIPREMPHVRTRHVDLRLDPRGEEASAVLALLGELRAEPRDVVVAYRGKDRWVPSYDRSPLGAPPESAGVRAGSVVLVTGGLGGIGLETAGYLARTAKAKLVLLGRSTVPPREDWDRLSSHGATDSTSHRIRKIRAAEEAGGEVLVLSADVCDRAQMESALLAARERFGTIHGVVHAAGQIDDGLIALKSTEAAHAVIGTKARGALLLESLFANDDLDFFVLFSSVSSILGLEGQVDYTAANAFLDAFANRLTSQGKTQAVSIHWNAWQDVGMAVVLADKGPTGPSSTRAGRGPHPFLAHVVADTDRELVVTTPFSRAEHWLLAEHALHGSDALIPGTGYLELARAALELHEEPRTVELRDVFFLAPFSVKVGETRELTLRVSRETGRKGEFVFVSEAEDAPHVTGVVAYVDTHAPARRDIGAILGRLDRGVRDFDGFLDQPFADFGPRWGSVRRAAYGAGEALVYLQLPSEYEADLRSFRLHPALLDMATGGAQATIPGFDQARDFYIPFSYGRLRLFRGIPARVVSHVRHKPGAAKDLATFDVTVHDEAGEVVLDITDFVMKRVDPRTVVPAKREAAPAARVTRLGAVVRAGILPKEGMDALGRIFASGVTRQIVACSVDLPDWIRRIDEDARPHDSAAAEHETEAGAFARPALSTTYAAPRDRVERELAGMWRELLGVAEIGVQDDFYELGGQSLIAVRLFNKIRKRYDVDLPLSVLFEAPTVAGMAKVVREEAGLASEPEETAEARPSATGSAPTGPEGERPAEAPRARRSRFRSLVPMQPNGALEPFFCVAGMGGTLGNLRKLALMLGDERPVHGLQPPGAEDEKERLYRVEELAAHYIREIRSVQPHGPYFLGGYSGGGVAAFEMARQLEGAGERVLFLGFLDSFSPALPLRPLTERAKIHLKRLQNHGPGYFVDTIERRLFYQTTVLVRRVNRELGRVFPHRYRYDNLADSWVVAEAQYRPQPWSGRATLFRARVESAVSLWTAVEVDDQHGWGRYLEGGVDVVICPGDHTTMCEEPHVRTLAHKIREAISAAASSPLSS